MPAAMSQKSLVEYIPILRNHYQRMSGKQARSRLLDEFCTVSGFERKYALKILNGRRRSGRGPGRGGAPRRYEGKVVEFPRFCGPGGGEHHDSHEQQQQNRSPL